LDKVQFAFKSNGYLHSSDSGCTVLSLSSQLLPSFKVTLVNKFPESLIHIGYNRHYSYYRIRGF